MCQAGEPAEFALIHPAADQGFDHASPAADHAGLPMYRTGSPDQRQPCRDLTLGQPVPHLQILIAVQGRA
jgi:hypothetical protein